MSPDSVPGRLVQTIPCTDAIGRVGTFKVIATPGHVTFVSPPGEAATVEPHQYGALRQALLDAFAVAMKKAP